MTQLEKLELIDVIIYWTQRKKLWGDKENNKKANYILFNPKIIQYSKETVVMEEGCLSLPEQYADVERPKEIVLEYIDEDNNTIKKKIGPF